MAYADFETQSAKSTRPKVRRVIRDEVRTSTQPIEEPAFITSINEKFLTAPNQISLD